MIIIGIVLSFVGFGFLCWLLFSQLAQGAGRLLRSAGATCDVLCSTRLGEINEHGEDGGFFVTYEGIREGKSFAKRRFTVTKTGARDDRDEVLQKKATRARDFTQQTPATEAALPYNRPDHVLNLIPKIAPGWDRQALVANFNQRKKGKAAAANPDGAFIGWVKKFTKNKRPADASTTRAKRVMPALL